MCARFSDRSLDLNKIFGEYFVEMGDFNSGDRVNGNMSVLKFSLTKNNKLTPAEWSEWLKNQSGLSEDYFEKISSIKYVDQTMEVTFDEDVNCFIVMREIKNSIVEGKCGICSFNVEWPQGKFEVIILKPKTAELLKKNNIVEALKDFGEIIEISNEYWHKISDVEIPTGYVEVRILSKKEIPSTLNIGGIKVKVLDWFYKLDHDDKVLKDLWDNHKSGREVDYTKKTFEMIDKKAGCKVIYKITCNKMCRPGTMRVIKWLDEDSGLSEEYLKKIVACKEISYCEFHILFDESVNCLLAMKEMTNRRFVDHTNNTFDVELSCPKMKKGKLVNVSLIPSEEDVNKVLIDRGISDAVLVRSKPAEYQFFVAEKSPDELEINGAQFTVNVAECQDEELSRIWEKIKLN